MTRPGYFFAGVAVLFVFWVWPWPSAPIPPFSAHMAMHMAVVAVATPLIALGIAGGPWDLVRRVPWLCAAVPASIVELIAVWSWHAPALHHAARHSTGPFVLEQATFFGAGLFLWISALGGTAAERRQRAASGVAGLLLTAMHMTLLGALLALTPRVLYDHGHAPMVGTLTELQDQQLGGAIMLIVGGVAYLAGGLGLTADSLLQRRKVREDG